MADEDRRRRNGKTPMTKEQLEKEEEDKRLREEEDRLRMIQERLEEEIENREHAEKTQLTEIIRSMLKSATMTTEHFSWDKINSYAIDKWPLDHSPLPYPEDQGRSELCIAFVTYHLLQMQANIIATRHRITSPTISLDYLKHVLGQLSTTEKTFENFLQILQDKGVSSDEG